MADTYNVWYTGQLKSDVDLEQAVAAFAARFHIHPQKVRDLLESGKEVSIKGGLDRAQALEYRTALERIGLVVHVDPPVDETAPPGEPAAPDVADDVPPVEAAGPAAASEAPHTGLADESAAHDPFEPPKAELEERLVGDFHEPRSVAASRGWGWLREGFSMVFARPLHWIGAVVIWTVIGLVLNLIPLVNILAAMITGVFLGGLMLGAHEQSTGGAFTIGHLFAGFSNKFGPLFLVGALYMIGFLAIGLVIGLGMGGLFFAAGGFSESGLSSPEAIAFDPMLWVFMLLGLALMIPLIMAYWFAPVLVVVDDVSALSAMGMSFRACLKNILPFLVYGIVALVLFLLGAIPVFLGLLIVVPAIVASIYTSYHDIFRG